MMINKSKLISKQQLNKNKQTTQVKEQVKEQVEEPVNKQVEGSVNKPPNKPPNKPVNKQLGGPKVNTTGKQDFVVSKVDTNNNDLDKFKICIKGFMDGYRNRQSNMTIDPNLNVSYRQCYKLGKECDPQTCVSVNSQESIKQKEFIEKYKNTLKPLFDNENLRTQYPKIYDLVKVKNV